MVVESYIENNLTSPIATNSVPLERRGYKNNYWLGLASLDDLKTNTLESAAGTLVSQYSGNTFLWIIPQYPVHSRICILYRFLVVKATKSSRRRMRRCWYQR